MRKRQPRVVLGTSLLSPEIADLGELLGLPTRSAVTSDA